MLGEESILNTRYYLEKKIGQGGFAKVFLATDTLLKRKVAIKLLNPELVDNEDFLSRFEGEAQSVAGLEHPNILGIYDYGRIEDTAFLVMPYIEGGTLYQKLKLDKKFSLPEANYYLQQLTAALDYAHRRNIVHRDIKPQNMLVRNEDNRLFLADFGIAKVLSSNTSHQSTQAVGTPSYMAPEQLQGSIGIGTDIYALGCVLFQMLTGETPFVGSPEQVITGHLWRPIPSIATRSHGDIPEVLQPLFDKALAKRIEDRFQSAGEMALVYQALISGGVSVTTPIVVPRNPQLQATNPIIRLPTSPTPPVQAQWSNTPAGVAGNTSQPTFNPTVPTQNPPVKRSKKGLLAAVAGLMGLVIAVVILLVALTGNSPTPPATPTNTVLPTLNVANLKEANDLFFVKGEFTNGLQKLKGLTDTFPSNAAAWRDYGHALHFWTRDNNDGVEQLQKAAQLDPKDALTQLYLTDALLDNYRFGEAETVANNAARLDPDGWMGHAALTTLYSRTARFAKARSELDLMQKAGGKATTDPYFNWIEGNSWYYSTEYPNYGQNYTAAYKFFDRTLLEWPNVPSIVGIRSFLFALSDYKINGAASLTKIEDMTKIQPKSSRLFSYLAHMNLFFESNDIKAERYAQAALEVNEANPQARLVLGGLEGRTKNYTVSYDYYERCVATDPYQDQCYADWANFLADNALENEVVGKTSEAQRLREIGLDKAKKAVGIAPTHYFWIYRLGYFYTLLRDYKNGVEQLEKAVAIRQDVAVTYGLLGLAYYGNGQRDKAQTAYDTGNKLDPTDFWVRRLGDTLAVK